MMGCSPEIVSQAARVSFLAELRREEIHHRATESTEKRMAEKSRMLEV